MSNFTPIVTPRLSLRKLAEADLIPFIQYRNDPDVARYQSWEHIGEEEALRFIKFQRKLSPGKPGRWFQLALELRTSLELIGDCGFKFDLEEPAQAEIGYTLARPHQGKGYATEAVTHLLDFLFSSLGLHRVIAITDCKNTSSYLLLEHLGFRREGHFIQNVWFKGAWGDEYLYAMLGKDWASKSG
jgi:RimJ/RimL family protein N-acetyltransferase